MTASGLPASEVERAFRQAFRASALGTSAATFEALTSLHRVYADHPGTTARDAGAIFANAAEFATLPNFGKWLADARSQAKPANELGWRGWVFEAEQVGRLSREGKVVDVADSVPHPATRRNVEVDAWIHAVPDLKRWVEFKAGQVTAGEIPQLEKQVASIARRSEETPVERALEWRVGGLVDESFLARAADLSKEFEVRILLFDANGRPMASFGG